MSRNDLANQLMRTVSRAARSGVSTWLRERRKGRAGGRARSGGGRSSVERPAAAYPGDYQGVPTMTYAPKPDGSPDPGEIVWTWVPFEEDHAQGKDRPVLLISREEPWLLGLQLTSQDHDRDADQEARAGRRWVDIGTGDWDSRGRASEVRVNRIIRIDPGAVRREGAVLPQDRFDRVAEGVRRHQ